MEKEIILAGIDLFKICATIAVIVWLTRHTYIAGYKDGFAKVVGADPQTIEDARKFLEQLQKEQKNANPKHA